MGQPTEKSDKNLKIAVVGLGHWGPNIVRSLDSNPNATVVAAVDLSSERLGKIKEAFPGIETFPTLDEAIKGIDFEAVVIATPTETHFNLGMIAVDAGKHILMEKPLTHDVTSSETLLKAAEDKGITIMTGHVFLYNNAVTRMKEVVDSGELGELLYVRSLRSNLGPVRSDVNALWDLASHDVSVFNYIFGSLPLRVSCTAFSPLGLRQQDLAQGSLEYPGNRSATFFVSWLDPQKRRELTVVGDRKMLVFDDMNPDDALKVYDKGVRFAPTETGYVDSFQSFRMSIHMGDEQSLNTATGQPLANECDHFVDCILNNKKPLSDGNNGLDVVRVLEALTVSLSRGGAPISLWSHEGPKLADVVGG